MASGTSAPRGYGPVRRPRARLVREAASGARLLRRVRLLWLVLAVLLLAASAMAFGAGAAYAYYARDLPSIEGFGTASLSQVTRIYASDGTTLLEERYRENRTVVDLDHHISVPLQQATIAVEDKDFYSHGGFDPVRVVGAAIYDLTHRRAAQGASTITQQVVKTSVLKAPERSFSRKIKELILATQLESRYSKKQILEMYLNTNFYGHRAYGIESAAQTYFHVHATDLALPEASFLAGIPQSPGLYDPLTSDGYAAARRRQRDVLRAMVNAGYIGQALSDAAYAKDLEAEIKAPASKPAPEARTSGAPHFVDYVLAQLREKYGDEFVDRGGLTIVTTLDPHAQELATQAVRSQVDHVRAITRPRPDPDDPGQTMYAPNNGAALVIAPRTGAVLAMVGSYDYTDQSINGARNMTADEPRQVGSSFKTYTYLTALANGYTASSVLEDRGGTFGPYTVSDFDRRELGAISLASSIQQSRNISSVRLFQTLGADRVFGTAEALGIPPSSLKNRGLSATLGANELRMMDHVAAYAGLSNHGGRVRPWVIAKMTDSSGRVIERHQAPKVEQAVPSSAALEISEILKGSLKPQGWDLKVPMAMKSGTTEHWIDSWYVGYTTDLAMGVWMGHTDDHSRHYHQNVIYGENGAGLIMVDFLRKWYQGAAPADFSDPQKPIDPCAVRPSPSPSPSPSRRPSPSSSSSPGHATPSPSSSSVPRAPYQYADAPAQVPGAGSSSCPTPPPGTSPSFPPGGGATPGGPPSNEPTPPPPIFIEPTPSPSAQASPSPSRCPFPPLCH